MDNYIFSNLAFVGDSVDSGVYHDSQLTEEQNRRTTFARRSAIVSTPDQAERQQLLPTSDETISEQKSLVDFDVSSSSPNILDPLLVDEPAVNESEDPFATLAAYYQTLTFNDDDTQPLLSSNPSLFGDINRSGAVLAEPEQPQEEFDPAGIIIPEGATPDTVSGKRSGMQRASVPRSSAGESTDQQVHDSLFSRFKRLVKKRRRLESKETELLVPPQATATRSESAASPETSATSRENIGSNMDKSRDQPGKKRD